ncbi:MAG: hypothetical protein ACRDPT_13590 [Streptomycetales bacterium]
MADGLAGYPEGAPYDRLVATCSVRRIPSAWLEQVRPGGRILVTVTGWLFAFGLVQLTVRPDGTAEGSFLTSDVSFMIARSQAPPGNMHIPAPDEGAERESTVGPDVFDDASSRWVVQCAAPWAEHARMGVYGEPVADYLVDARSGAFAVLRKGPDGVVLARQGGPERLWDRVERAVSAWRGCGAPDVQAFRVSVTPTEQLIGLDTAVGPLTWPLR